MTTLKRQKNTTLRTVVNKLDSIHAEFRYFDMEVLAGEEDFITTCVSRLDFFASDWHVVSGIRFASRFFVVSADTH